jgi:hypothetical protein
VEPSQAAAPRDRPCLYGVTGLSSSKIWFDTSCVVREIGPKKRLQLSQCKGPGVCRPTGTFLVTVQGVWFPRNQTVSPKPELWPWSVRRPGISNQPLLARIARARAGSLANISENSSVCFALSKKFPEPGFHSGCRIRRNQMDPLC